MSKFVSQSNAQALMNAIGAKFDELASAYIFKGSVAFANLPATLTAGMGGYVYNITDDFTTDARFVEGAGKKYAAGTDVAVVDLSTYDAVTPVGSENPSAEGWFELVGGRYVLSEDTEVDAGKTYYEYNAEYKLNVAASFVNVEGIQNRITQVANDIVAATFNPTSPAAYAIGDLVKKDDVLYRFTAAHTAGDPWDATEVEVVTVEQLISEVGGDVARLNKLEAALADQFSTSVSYAEDAFVMYQDEFYVFTSAHPAGAWTGSDVSKVTFEEFVVALNTATNDRVDDIRDNIADSYDSTQSYVKGDVFIFEDVLYQVTDNGGMTGTFDPAKVTAITVEEMIAAAEPEALSNQDVNDLIALLS